MMDLVAAVEPDTGDAAIAWTNSSTLEKREEEEEKQVNKEINSFGWMCFFLR